MPAVTATLSVLLGWALDFVQVQWRPLTTLWVTLIMLIVLTVRGHERRTR